MQYETRGERRQAQADKNRRGMQVSNRSIISVQQALAKRAQAADKAARERLVQAARRAQA